MPTKVSDNLQTSLDVYAAAGYTLIPLKGKIPTVLDWTKAEYNPFPDTSDFPHGNFGVVIGDEDLIIDIDPRNFEKDKDSFALLTTAIPTITQWDTPTVRTGSGGLHIYLKKPKDIATRELLKDFAGIEFKAKGRQVVGFGSIHPDTNKPYELIKGSFERVMQAPKELLDLLSRATVVSSTKEKIIIDDEQTRTRYAEYLKKAPPAVQGMHGDHTTFIVAAVGHDLGLPLKSTFDLMIKYYNPRCTPMWTEAALSKKIQNAYKYSDNVAGHASPVGKFEVIAVEEESLVWDMDEKGVMKKTLRNTVNQFLRKDSPLNGLFGFNEFTQDIVFLKRAPWHTEFERYTTWTDEDCLRCKEYLAVKWRFEPQTAILHEAALVTAHKYRFHPIKEYLECLEWDNYPRLTDWMSKFLGADGSVYTRAVAVKTLVAAVARIYEPGIKFDYIPILEGAQGTGKSSALKILAAPWFSDQVLDIHNRDTIDAMRGKWMIEISEMETHKRTETQAMKAFLSRDTDRVRLAYARCSKDFPRQCIFIGTINPEADEVGYLKDTTGNRRYWPIKTTVIDLKGLSLVRDQLWAEAVIYYKKQMPLYMSDTQENQEAIEQQYLRMGVDPWSDKIRNWLSTGPGAHKMVVTAQAIFCDCLGGKVSQLTRREQVRIAEVMKQLNWDKGVFYDNSVTDSVRGYRRPTIE